MKLINRGACSRENGGTPALRLYIDHQGCMAVRFLGGRHMVCPNILYIIIIFFSFRADVQVVSNIGIGIYVEFNLADCGS